MLLDTIFKIFRISAIIVGITSLMLFVFSLRAQKGKRTMMFRIITATLVCVSILVLIFATSPFTFYAPAPAPPSAQIVGLKHDNELFTLRVSDGNLKTVSTSIDPPGAFDHNSIAFISNGVAYIQLARSAVSQVIRLSDGSPLYPDLPNTAPLIYGDVGYFPGIKAVNLRTQTTIWQQDLGGFGGFPIGVDNDILYAETGYDLFALRISDGAIQWSVNFSAQFQDFTSYRFMLQSGAVYITGQEEPDYNHPDVTYKLIKVESGKIRWQLASASALAPDGNRLYIGISIPHENVWQMAAVDVSDGHTIWQLPFAGQPNSVKLPLTILHSPSFDSSSIYRYSQPALYSSSPIGSPPNIAVANGILYFVGEDDSNGEKDGTCAAFAIRGKDGSHLWEQPSDLCNTSYAGYMGYLYGTDTVIIGSGIVYISFVDKGSYLDAFDAVTGKVLWSNSGILDGLFPGAAVIYANPTSCEIWQISCDTKDTSGAYFDVRNPQTGARYWRYQANDVTNFLVTANA